MPKPISYLDKTTMKSISICFFIAVINLVAQEVSPEKIPSPAGSQHFSGKTKSYASPLAELIAMGTGHITFEPDMLLPYIDKDGKMVHTGTETISYTQGLLVVSLERESSVKISVTSDGWLVFQHGNEVQMIPVARIKKITGHLPE